MPSPTRERMLLFRAIDNILRALIDPPEPGDDPDCLLTAERAILTLIDTHQPNPDDPTSCGHCGMADGVDHLDGCPCTPPPRPAPDPILELEWGPGKFGDGYCATAQFTEYEFHVWQPEPKHKLWHQPELGAWCWDVFLLEPWVSIKIGYVSSEEYGKTLALEFFNAYRNLEAKLGREPTVAEIGTINTEVP